LNWTAAAANGSASLNGYTVTCTPSCTIASQPGANATSLTVTGLSAGTNYTFSVVANASDSQNSSAATASARTAYGAPGAVTGVTATQPFTGTVILRWKAPVNVGAGITSYTITYTQNGKIVTKSVTGLTTTLSGLTKVAHVFSIVANASNGVSSTTSTVSLLVR
jgi:titin